MRFRVESIAGIAFLVCASAVAGGPGLDLSDGPVAASPRRTVFVDGDSFAPASGLPANGTMQRPYGTIQEAIRLAEIIPTITEIYVDRSTRPYVGPVEIERGDLALLGDNWFEGVDEHPVIARSLVPTGPTVDIVGQVNVLVEGFEVEVGAQMGGVARGTAIRVGDSSDVLLRDLIVTGANPYAERLTRGILVRNSARVTIEHSLFADLDHLNAADFKYIRPVLIEDSVDTIVQNCEFTRIGEINDMFSFVHIFKGIELIGGKWNTVRNNLFHDLTFVPVNPVGSGGIPEATQSDIGIILGRGSEHLTVINNTVAGIDALGIQTPDLVKNLQGIVVTNIGHADIRNNLLAYIDWVRGGFDAFFAHLHFCPTPCDPPDPPTIYFTAVTSDWEGDYLPDSMAGNGTFLLNAVEALDPVFVDRAGGDFRLDPDSRCVDAGDPVISDPDGSVSDLGCYGGPRGDLPVGTLRSATPFHVRSAPEAATR